MTAGNVYVLSAPRPCVFEAYAQLAVFGFLVLSRSKKKREKEKATALHVQQRGPEAPLVPF